MTRLFRQLPQRPADLEGRFGLMGELLLVQTDHPAILAAATDAFGRFPLPAGDPDPLVLRLFVDEPGAAGSASSTAARPAGPWPAPRYLTDRHLFLVDLAGDGSAACDLSTGLASGRISAALTHDPPYLRLTVVEAMALALLQARGYLAVHASCVIVDGVALMVQAPAGTGKSTLAYAAVRAGFGVLAEDVVFVRPAADGGRPVAWGSPWRLHLLPDSPQHFPELAGLDSRRQLNGEWKLEVDIAARFPGAAIPCAAAGPQVILERGPADGDPILRLSEDEARDAFEVLWPWGLPWDAEREAAAAALRAGGVHRVRMSGTPAEAVDLLRRLVAQDRGRAAGPSKR